MLGRNFSSSSQKTNKKFIYLFSQLSTLIITHSSRTNKRAPAQRLKKWKKNPSIWNMIKWVSNWENSASDLDLKLLISSRNRESFTWPTLVQHISTLKTLLSESLIKKWKKNNNERAVEISIWPESTSIKLKNWSKRVNVTMHFLTDSVIMWEINAHAFNIFHFSQRMCNVISCKRLLVCCCCCLSHQM